MRKTRLVILPTKCLHQMGFLLLFLSCPVIGDWGRIRPESENSHNAIQIQREGTCGFERDPPGGLLDFLNETGSKQCRLSEDSDLSKPIEKPSLEEPVTVGKSDGSRVNTRRINQWESERRITQRRETRREFQRNIRSRSVESRRSNYRNDERVRSLSLSRLESERSARRYSPENRRETERLRMNRRNEGRVEQQRRLNRDISNERRENEIRGRNIAERRERETRRITRSTEREREDTRRDNNRRVLARRENDIRSQDRERRENVRVRLSLARREIQNANQERTENRRSTSRINLERRQPEIRKARSLENISRERTIKITRHSDAEERRFVSLSPKVPERRVRERRVSLLNERVDGKAKRMNFPEVREINLENKNSEDKKPYEEVSEWTNFKNYESFQTGDWTTNCIIGAAVYFFTTRQIKAV